MITMCTDNKVLSDLTSGWVSISGPYLVLPDIPTRPDPTDLDPPSLNRGPAAGVRHAGRLVVVKEILGDA